MKRKLILTGATLGPIGYLPSPGSIATLVTLPCIYYVSSTWWYSAIGLGLLGPTFLLSQYASRYFEKKDPSQIVIDEVLGCWITFWFLPKTLFILCAGFVLFRFFDIVKPLGIRWVEKIPGGIVWDDIVAGMVSNIIIQIFM